MWRFRIQVKGEVFHCFEPDNDLNMLLRLHFKKRRLIRIDINPDKESLRWHFEFVDGCFYQPKTGRKKENCGLIESVWNLLWISNDEISLKSWLWRSERRFKSVEFQSRGRRRKKKTKPNSMWVPNKILGLGLFCKCNEKPSSNECI